MSLDEENGLAKCADHFNLTQEDKDGNGSQTSLVQAPVIRDVTQGLIPQRQTITGAIPFNLMRLENLVWVHLAAMARLLEAQPKQEPSV